MRIFVFKKIGFKDRQSEKLKDANNRKAILIDVNINNDMKMLCLHQQKDYTLLPTYLEIIFNLDLETESWEVREDSLISWCKRTFGVNNRFNIEQRLEFLQSQGLISFEVIGNNTKTIPEVSVNNDQTYQEVIPNLSETIVEVTPLETPETLAALRATITNQVNKDKVTNIPQTPKGESEGFLSFYENYPKKTTKAEAWEFWKKNKLDDSLSEIMDGLNRYNVSEQWLKEHFKYTPDPIRFLKNKKWVDHPPVYTPPKQPYQIHSTALPGNQITPAHLRQSGVIDIS